MVSQGRAAASKAREAIGAKAWIGFSPLTVDVISAEQTSQIYFSPPSFPLMMFFLLITPMSLEEASPLLSQSEEGESSEGDVLRLREFPGAMVLIVLERKKVSQRGLRRWMTYRTNNQAMNVRR